MKTTRGICKKSRRNGTLFGFSVSTEIKVLMGVTASEEHWSEMLF
jgi:putative transposase